MYVSFRGLRDAVGSETFSHISALNLEGVS